MVKRMLYLEGGGDSKELHTRCREGFRKLFQSCGFDRRMPRLVACGGRGATFDDFSIAHHNKADDDVIAMLVDSEDPIVDPEQTWDHLRTRDGWQRPNGATDKQVLLMCTCMETWIAADRDALKQRYRNCLREASLPMLNQALESRSRHDVLNDLKSATKTCKKPYAKGSESFELLGELSPETLRVLPCFLRTFTILDEVL
jgi:hypothetical protein